MSINIKMGELSGHLQTLRSKEFYPAVEKAVNEGNKNALIEICKKAKIPMEQLGAVVSTLLAMASTLDKYPDWV